MQAICIECFVWDELHTAVLRAGIPDLACSCAYLGWRTGLCCSHPSPTVLSWLLVSSPAAECTAVPVCCCSWLSTCCAKYNTGLCQTTAQGLSSVVNQLTQLLMFYPDFGSLDCDSLMWCLLPVKPSLLQSTCAQSVSCLQVQH